MKILITGVTGLLGSRFYHVFAKYHDAIGTYFLKPKREFHYLSLLDKSSIDSLIYEAKPDIVIHTAGIADPDKCEEDKEKAYEINVKGTEYIVDACQRNQASLIFISSAHVFSEGKPSEKEKTKLWNLKLIPIILKKRFDCVYCLDPFTFISFYISSPIRKYKMIFDVRVIINAGSAFGKSNGKFYQFLLNFATNLENGVIV